MQLDGDELLAPGTKLGGRFEIVRLIGSGGMAAVYEALHTDLKKRVAIKALFPSVGRNPEARARFLREGEVASRIRHPHVVDVTDVGSDGGLAFLVMEYLDGEDLGALIEREAPLAFERTVDLLLPVIAAVAAGHGAGVVHRDLKPQNIFLARGFRGELVPKVLDFGVSKLVTGLPGAALTQTAAVFGTPAYMSPEQALGAKQVDHRCDQYALALIIYECVTGRRAHDGENALAILRSIGDGVFDPPSRHRPDLPPILEQVVLTALALDPAQRYSSSSALGAALLPFASTRGRALWAETFAASASTEPGFHAPTMRLPVATAKLAAVETRPPSTTMPVVAAPDETEPAIGAKRGLLLAVAALGVVVVVGGVALLGSSHHPRPALPPRRELAVAPAPAPPLFTVEVQVEPPEATLEVDGQPVGQGKWVTRLPADGRLHKLAASAAGYQPRTIEFRDEPPPRAIALEKVPAAAPPPVPATRPAQRKPRPARLPTDDPLLNRR
jgi:tRNA A-37 threonylcarbamoyl transferase component Bud32